MTSAAESGPGGMTAQGLHPTPGNAVPDPGEFSAEDDEPMRRPQKPLFLERETYRRRRLMDAARLLPIFGGALLLVPMFWGRGHGSGSAAIYLFLVWLGIILVSGLLARRLSAPLRRRSGTPLAMGVSRSDAQDPTETG